MTERIAKGLSPIFSISGMMQFIENGERRRLATREPIHLGREAHLLVGHDASMVIPVLFRLLVAQIGIETDTGRMGGAGPLLPQMIRGADDDDARGGLPLQQIVRD